MFADFSAGYVADCASEIVVPVFMQNNTEVDMTSDTAIHYDSSSGNIIVQTDDITHLGTYQIAIKFKSSM